MASRARMKTFTALAFARGLALTFESVYRTKERNKTILAILARVKSASDAAFDMWPHDLTQKDIRILSAKIEALRQEQFSEGKPATVLISFTEGVVGDVRDHIKNSRRGKALDELIAALEAWRKYYDRKGDKFDEYDEANEGVKAWDKKIEAEAA